MGSTLTPGQWVRLDDAPARAHASTPEQLTDGTWNCQYPAPAAGTVGVFGWDVDPQDWAAWEARASAEDAAAELVSACVAAGRGVVLLHDCSADPGDRGVRLRAGNRALESVRLALPALRGHGFTFVPLSDVSPGRR